VGATVSATDRLAVGRAFRANTKTDSGVGLDGKYWIRLE
jgi:hypothetical protein